LLRCQKWFEKVSISFEVKKQAMSKIYTYFGFKNGNLVSVVQSVNKDTKEALDCSYFIAEPQQVEDQISKWKKDKSEQEKNSR
jgi:predicted transcriptional regulator